MLDPRRIRETQDLVGQTAAGSWRRRSGLQGAGSVRLRTTAAKRVENATAVI
jgi:hypothetical protein